MKYQWNCCLLSITLIIISGAGLAADTPPAKEGNNGIPFLKYQIQQLESELEATNQQLSEATALLKKKESDIESLNTELLKVENEVGQLSASLEKEQNLYRIPATGQKECWFSESLDPDDPHVSNSCSGSGQDAEYKSGLPLPMIRFIDNQDGTFTDNFTKLTWLKKGDCYPGIDWHGALEAAENLEGHEITSICGLADGSQPGDWRVPNVRELQSLLDYRTADIGGNRSLPTTIPLTGVDVYYWSSTSFAVNPTSIFSDLIFACSTRNYGADNRFRFSDAYVVNFLSGETIHTPKEAREDIDTRHGIYDPGIDNNPCATTGFRSASPPNGIPNPGFIAVKNEKD
ncbi:DUF1566 domain-containing protein [Thalassotalea sp. PS06]|uniref:Lcl C-terminal domain-containing protein n=1 Tax=Thalassotalea sp. PS06 TaxID=2594005 RepID=UPI0011632E60|nr:DUF1566 domain-containing protein [Thalassotalea sp. PS06]QDP02294.1 DUF1566 domain-containing protein [Thalassotalea sp. PS06]